MEPALYAYEESTRRPAVIFSLAVALFMLCLAALNDGPWWFVYPMLLLALAIARVIAIDRRSGCVLSQGRLRFYAGKWSREFAAADMGNYSVTEWMDGPASVQLALRDGSTFSCPQMCLGPIEQFCRALDNLGVKRRGA
jgi:hypothetical protein